MKVLGKRLSRGAAVAMLLILLSVSSAAAWVLGTWHLAVLTGDVKCADVKWGEKGLPLTIAFDEVGSGYPFGPKGDFISITVVDAKELIITFTLEDGLDVAEYEAVDSFMVRIFEDKNYNGELDGDDVVWAEQDVKAGWTPKEVTLAEGAYYIGIQGWGVAGYPPAPTPFSVCIDVEVRTP